VGGNQGVDYPQADPSDHPLAQLLLADHLVVVVTIRGG
jgi:hypothetical protein